MTAMVNALFLSDPDEKKGSVSPFFVEMVANRWQGYLSRDFVRKETEQMNRFEIKKQLTGSKK